MGILDKIFKKNPKKSSDNFKIFLKTDKNLSEVQENTIFDIVRSGLKTNLELSSIAFNVSVTLGIYQPVVINPVINGIEVIF